MKGWELLTIGIVYSLVTGVSEFVFNYKMNSFALSLGIVFGSITLLIIESMTEENG